MPASITIRNVPDATRDKPAARAARSGRSMQEYAVDVGVRPPGCCEDAHWPRPT